MNSLTIAVPKCAIWLAAFSLGFATAGPLSAQSGSDPAARGNAIALEADRRDQGFGDSRAKLTMILRDQSGRTRERRLDVYVYETRGPRAGDKTLAVFQSPPDLAGTGFLSHAKILDHDDQWIYLPALKRVKRISAANKTGAFFGSEFTYEDIAAQEFGKFDNRWVQTESCAGRQCFVVERRPKYPGSGYSALMTWFDTASYRVHRIDYYDRRGKLLKRLILSNYRQYLGKFWRAHRFEMSNLRTGQQTTLLYDNFAFRTGISEQAFSPGQLGRAR